MTNNFRGFSLSYSPHTGMPAPDDALDHRLARVILLTIQNDLLPPIFYGHDPLQRMRAIIVPPGANLMFPPSEVTFTAVSPASSIPEGTPLSPRPVQGDILRDRAGRLYEKIGTHIRPLHKLVPGPHGEVLDIGPSVQKNLPMNVPFAKPANPDSGKTSEETQHVVRPQVDEPKKSEAFAPAASERPSPAPFRKLFPEAGLRRLVLWGDFKPMLAAQLAHPERLHDSQRLPCCVQIYEVTAPLRLESLAAMVLGEVKKMNQLHLLTADLAGKLQLEALLQRRPRVPAEIRREPGMLLPYDFIFQLQLAQDPTRHNVTPNHAQQRTPSTPPLPLAGQPFTPAMESSNGAPSQAAVAQPAPAGAQKLSPKNEIPRQFVQPHEFRLSREEVLYDLRLEALPKGLLASLLRRLKKMFAGRAEFRKWQALLNGKNFDEQLWTVRPPKGMLAHSAIREWACKTLLMAGYDSQTMLLEWEIFWRRKG